MTVAQAAQNNNASGLMIGLLLVNNSDTNIPPTTISIILRKTPTTARSFSLLALILVFLRLLNGTKFLSILCQ